MAIEGGEIVSRHIIDNSDLRTGLQEGERMMNASARRASLSVRDASGRFVAGMNPRGVALLAANLRNAEMAVQKTANSFRVAGRHTNEFTLASHALGSSLHLVTGETGFLAVELIRTTGHLSKMVAVAGGVTAAVTALGAATKGFLVSIGPVGWALLGLGAAYLAYTKIVGDSEEATQAATKKHEQALTAYEAERKAILDLMEAKGQLTKIDRRRMELESAAGGAGNYNPQVGEAIRTTLSTESAIAAINRQKAIAEQDIRDEYDLRIKLNEDFMQKVEKGGAYIDSLRDKRMRDEEFAYEQRVMHEEEFWKRAESLAAQAEQRRQSVASNARQAAIQFGGMKPSDFLTGPQRDIALATESANERLKAAGQGGRGFGIGSADASRFRFGPAAEGSVIGQQNEQKNTTKAVEKVEAAIREEFQELIKELRGKGYEIFPAEYKY